MIIISPLGSTENLKEAVDFGLTFYRLPLLCSNICILPAVTYNGIIQKSKMYEPPAPIMPTPIISTPYITPYITPTPITTTPIISTPPTPIATPIIESKVVYYGSPGRTQYPNNSYEHNLARSIWDMQCHHDRIYIGNGDAWGNQGPVTIWSIGNNETGFKQEITIMEEMCYTIREYNDKLIIPGTDSYGDSSGNIYTKNDVWKTIPIYATKISDACSLGNMLYTTLLRGSASLLMKTDGVTWKTIVEYPNYDDGLVSLCLPLDDFIIFEASEKYISYIFRCSKDDKIEKLYIRPNYSSNAPMYRSARYKNGYLCVFSYPLHVQYAPYPLYFLTTSNITMVDFFKNAIVRDVVVRGNDVYALTAEIKDNSFWGYIYYSPNLINWTLLSSFNLTSMPNSFEFLEGSFYVGTCIKEFNNTVVSEADSGSIYKIRISPPAPIGILNGDLYGF